MKAARRIAYQHCECGLLVRLAVVLPESPEGQTLADVRACAYVGECPGCKLLVQSTFALPSAVIKPTLTLTKD